MAEKYVCPASFSWGLLFGRGLIHNPSKILNGLVKEGDVTADIGCGPGYFTLALSVMTGAAGKVYAVDLQQEMLDKAKKRIKKAGRNNNVTYIKCGQDSLNLPAGLDFAMAFWMVHEVPDTDNFFKQIVTGLKPGGKLLVAEPIFHVSTKDIEDEKLAATRAGLQILTGPRVFMSRVMLLEKKQ